MWEVEKLKFTRSGLSLLIILSGRHDTFFGTKLKHENDLDYITFYFVCFINEYSKLIGCVIEGRKCSAGGSDQNFLLLIP